MVAARFLRENARWIGGGFLLTFFSSFGQTFFISLMGGHIRADFGLSPGGFGTLYMLATLASALTLPRLGRIVDTRSVAWTVVLCVGLLALACLGMALASNLPLLFASIYGLRLFGQGMMNHIAFTAMGKWFSANRGKAVSFMAIGVNFGEALLPIGFVTLSALIGWRSVWLVVAILLAVVALPVITALMRVERAPQAADGTARRGTVRHWTRGEVLRDPLFYLLLTGTLGPPFIITSIIFHQVYLVELRGWALATFAGSFVFMSIATVSCTLLSGGLVDRIGAPRLLPVFLVPLACGCLLLGVMSNALVIPVFMALAGVTYGIQSTLFGALWPEIYGTRHLGAIRSALTSIMVFATAAGPGLTGFLIDKGVDFPHQIVAFGLYLLAVCGTLAAARRLILARAAGSV